MKKITLVEDWRNWWRWHSTKFIIALGILPTVWAEIPEEWKSSIPDSWLRWVSIVVMGVGVYARMVSQEKKSDVDTDSQ